jgi:hypothetical protein
MDPRSPSVTHGVKGLGDYTIPMANKFASDGDPNTLGEMFAYGFRNAHRISWDPMDGTMFASDIGMDSQPYPYALGPNVCGTSSGVYCAKGHALQEMLRGTIGTTVTASRRLLQRDRSETVRKPELNGS